MPFTYQKWLRQESEQRIINALYDGDKGFGDLLDLTDLSKPILSERLKDLTRRGKIDVVPHKATKRFLYTLIKESLDQRERAHLFFHKRSQVLVKGLEEAAKDPSTSEEEYIEILGETVMELISHTLTVYLMAPRPAMKEWLRMVLGSEFANKMSSIFPKERLMKSKETIIRLAPEEALLFEKGSPEEMDKNIAKYIARKSEKLEEKRSSTTYV